MVTPDPTQNLTTAAADPGPPSPPPPPPDPVGTVAGDPTGCLGALIGDLTGDLIALCREDGTLLHVNRPGLAMLRGGAKTAPVVGAPLAAFFVAEYRAILADGLAVLETEPQGLPVVLRRADGTAAEATISARRLPAALVPASLVPDPAGKETAGKADHDLLLVHGRDLHDKVRAVNTLVANHKRFLRIVEQSIDMVCLLKDGRITFINPTGRRLLGAPTVDPLLGHPFADFVCPEYRGLFEDGLDDLARETALVPLILSGLSGQPVEVEARVTPFLIDGHNAHMVEARDITAQKRAAEGVRAREQRLAGILAHVGEGIFTLSPSGLVESFNLAAERIFGLAADQVVGHSPDRLIPGFSQRFLAPDLPAAPLRARRDAGASLGREAEMTGRRSDGRRFPLTLTVTRLPQGNAQILIAILRDISERKRTEERERRHTEILEQRVAERTQDIQRLARENERILQAAGDGILGVDLARRITFANAAAGAILGLAPADLLHAPLDHVLRRRGRDGSLGPVIGGSLAEPVARMTEVGLLRADDTPFPAELTLAPLEDDDGASLGAVLVLRDVTDQRRAQTHLRIAATILDHAAEGVALCSGDSRLSMVNPAFCRITGSAASDLKGRPLPTVLAHADAAALQALQKAIADGTPWEGEVWTTRADGSPCALRLTTARVISEEGQTQAVIILSDITQRKRDEENIRRQATTDSLTGLANRALFMDRLSHTVRLALRAHWTSALLFIDLDGFKAINDTLGHDAGDLLLQQAALRLRGCARDSDTLARLGGDEFTVILNNLADPTDACLIAGRILDSLSRPFDLNGRTGRISASIGIALVPQHADSSEALLTRADQAMYRAKTGGKRAWCLYDVEARKTGKTGKTGTGPVSLA